MNGNGRSNGDKPPNELPNAKWAVMVYLAGDNNLTPNCITVLQQMEAVKYTDDISVLACFDSNTPWPKGSRYLAVNGKRHKNDEHLDWEIYNDLIITQRRGHNITAPDFCGSPNGKGSSLSSMTPMTKTDVAEGLRRFLKWAMETQRKADRYMLVLYGHGPLVAGNTFLVQDNPVSSVHMKDLPELLEPHFGGDKPKLDILAFQNCAMNGVETAYEIKDRVDYMIGSQGLVLAYGWPYTKIIQTVVDNRTQPTLTVTEEILKVCARHLVDFSVMDRSSEQSVCDLTKLGNGTDLTQAVNDLGGKLQNALGFKEVPAPKDSKAGEEADKTQIVLTDPIICDAIRLARLEAQSYWGETFVDLFDFCDRLLKNCNRAKQASNDLISSMGLDRTLAARLNDTDFVTKLREIMTSCEAVMKTITEMVPHSYYIGSELQYSHGLSIYFPWSLPRAPYSFFTAEKGTHTEHILITAFETYSGYEFCKATIWPAFLKSFYRATLRNVRRAERKYSVAPANNSFAAGNGFASGLVREEFTPRESIVSTDFLQKTESTGGGDGDDDMMSNVKNYPRRYYLSPSDCPRKIEMGGRIKAGDIPVYPNSRSTPVSYLGWNICEFLANVIVKKERNGNHSSSEKTVPVPVAVPVPVRLPHEVESAPVHVKKNE